MHEVRMLQLQNFHSGNKQSIKLRTTPKMAELRATLCRWPSESFTIHLNSSCLHIDREDRGKCLEGLNEMTKARN